MELSTITDYISIDGKQYPLIGGHYVSRLTAQRILGYTHGNIFKLLNSGRLQGVRLEPGEPFSPWLISIESVLEQHERQQKRA